jgi:ubiquinone/menaquinone biosynthesis C-methylase UbiE
MAHHRHKFDPTHRKMLLDPERARYLPAREILARFPVKAGDVAADIGCGPGYFTVFLAEAVGPEGRVHAVDTEPAMLDDLRDRLRARPDLRVDVVPSSEERIPLPDDSVDFAFLACVLHELNGPGTLREAARILRPTGALGVVDWKKVRQAIGPPYGHRLSPRQVGAAIRDGGLVAEEPFEAGPYHYGLVARPLSRIPARAGT